VVELYPMVGEVVSAWMQNSGKEIDDLAAGKNGSGAQAGDVFTAGDSKYRALADEIKSFMKLTHLFLHFSTSVGEFYPRLMSEATPGNIKKMETLTRQTEKLLHLKGVPAANTLVKDSFAVLAEGAKLFSKDQNARPLYRSLQRTMEFWGVLGTWVDQKLASAKSQASRLHPNMIALFNGYGNELAIDLQQLASEMESQEFPGVEDSARLNMVTALRHASESLDILNSALEVTKKIDTHVAPAPNQSLIQQLKAAYDKLNVSDTGQDIEAWQRLLKEIDPPDRKESSAPPKKKDDVDEVEASGAPTALSADDVAILERERGRFAETVGELKRLRGTDIERATRELLKAQTVKNGLPVRMAKAEKFEQEAAKTIDRGIQTIRKQLAQLESIAATLEDQRGETDLTQEARALRTEWEQPLARLEKEKANYLAKGWSSVTHRVNLFQALPRRSELFALIESKQITKVKLVLWRTMGPNMHLRAWDLHATNGEHQQHHIFVDDNGVPLFSHTKPVGQGGSDDAWHGRTPDDPKLLKEDLETLTQLSGGWLPDPYQAEFDVPLRDVALADFIRQ
jgi:hypothetical protein